MILWSDKAEAKRLRGIADRLEAEVTAERMSNEIRQAAIENKLRRAKEWREKAEKLDPQHDRR